MNGQLIYNALQCYLCFPYITMLMIDIFMLITAMEMTNLDTREKTRCVFAGTLTLLVIDVIIGPPPCFLCEI